MRLCRSIPLAAAMLLCATACAQLVDRPFDVDGLVAQLDSESADAREAASTALHDAPGSALKDMFQAMRRPDLSLEQRKRLEVAARGPFEQSPRAGLGVRFDLQSDESDAPRIMGTVEAAGFEAHKFLKPGDTIKQLDGIPVQTREQARHLIMSHDPQDLIDIVVVRQGNPMRFSVRLGSYPELNTGINNNFNREAESMASAYQMRLLRELGDSVHRTGSKAIDCGLDADAWRDVDAQARLQASRAREKLGGPAVNAMPAIAPAGKLHANVQQLNRAAAIVNQQWLANEIRRLRIDLDTAQQRITKLKAALNQPGLRPDEAVQLRAELDQESRGVQILAEQLINYQRRLNNGR